MHYNIRNLFLEKLNERLKTAGLIVYAKEYRSGFYTKDDPSYKKEFSNFIYQHNVLNETAYIDFALTNGNVLERQRTDGYLGDNAWKYELVNAQTFEVLNKKSDEVRTFFNNLARDVIKDVRHELANKGKVFYNAEGKVYSYSSTTDGAVHFITLNHTMQFSTAMVFLDGDIFNRNFPQLDKFFTATDDEFTEELITLKNDIDFGMLNKDNVSEENYNKVFVARFDKYYGYFEADKDVAENNMVRCVISGYLLTRLTNGFNERIAMDGNAYSSYAYKTHIKICAVCNDTYAIIKNDENGLCSHCLNTAKNYKLDIARLKAHRYSIQDHNYKPDRLLFLKDDSENDLKVNPLFLGVELEVDASEYSQDECGCGEDDCEVCSGYNDVDSRSNANFVLHAVNSGNYNESVISKWDGSLNNGFELVSTPMTLAGHFNTKNVAWENGIKVLKNMGYTSHDFGTCGLHVHINRNFFGTSKDAQDYNGAKIAYLMEKYWDDFVRFSRRRAGELERWARKGYAKDDFDRDELKTTKTLSDVFKKNYDTSNKYIALNTIHSNTFEFRIFRGTLNYNTFKATLQFVHNLAHLVRKTSLAKLFTLTFDDIINHKDFTELKTYWNARKSGRTITDHNN
jgi:hypothetical protein